jgi:site-specific DNA-methyltransferase (adenine-specific)
MDHMAGLPDKFYDLAIVDPPYGIGMDGNEKSEGKHGGRKAHIKKNWDKKPPDQKYFNEIFRISKEQIIFGINYFIDKINKPSMGWIVWDKEQRIKQSDGELIYTSFNRALRIIKINRVVLLKEGTILQVQKPIKLYKWLLKKYDQPGWKIFDSHEGSGSHRIACYDMGFYHVGCENDKDIWRAQEERFKQHVAQKSIFPVEEIQQSIYEQELI